MLTLLKFVGKSFLAFCAIGVLYSQCHNSTKKETLRTLDENLTEINQYLGLRDGSGESDLLHGDVLRLKWVIPEWTTIDQTADEMTDFVAERAAQWPEANAVELSVELLDGKQRLQMGTLKSPPLDQIRQVAKSFENKLHHFFDPHFKAALSGMEHVKLLYQRSM